MTRRVPPVIHATISGRPLPATCRLVLTCPCRVIELIAVNEPAQVIALHRTGPESSRLPDKSDVVADPDGVSVADTFASESDPRSVRVRHGRALRSVASMIYARRPHAHAPGIGDGDDGRRLLDRVANVLDTMWRSPARRLPHMGHHPCLALPQVGQDVAWRAALPRVVCPHPPGVAMSSHPTPARPPLFPNVCSCPSSRRMTMHDRPTMLRQRRQRPLGVTDSRQPTAKRQGLSQSEVRAAILAQGGLCAVGGEPLGALVMVDHDHELAARHGHNPERGCPACYRGILCNGHNAALGAFGDDPALLRRAADYLERRR